MARVQRKKNKRGDAWAEVVTHTGEILIARDEAMILFLTTFARDHTPAILDTKQNDKGHQEIMRVEQWTPEEAPPAEADPA